MKNENNSNYTDTTLAQQFKNVFVGHLRSLVIVFIIFFAFFISLQTISIVNKICGILSILIYALMMAGAGNKCASQDKLSCATTKPHPAKGFLLSLPITASNIIFWALLQLVWMTGINGISLIGQIIFGFWSYPYRLFLQLQGPDMSIIGIILMIVIPPIFTGLGYLAGYFNWDIYEKLDKIVFEKK